MVRGAPVLMVDSDRVRVERALAAGELACPGCGGVLGPWVWRGAGGGVAVAGPGSVFVHVGAAAGPCQATHVLLPVSGLLRRVDLAEVIGAALLARARQASLRQIAGELGVPLSTVGAGSAGSLSGRSARRGRRSFRQAGGLAGAQRGDG